jgi:hypothetical protein
MSPCDQSRCPAAGAMEPFLSKARNKDANALEIGWCPLQLYIGYTNVVNGGHPAAVRAFAVLELTPTTMNTATERQLR